MVSTHSKPPVITFTVLSITAFLTAMQFAVPGLLDALKRTPAAITSNQWWRFITPIFINRGGWKEITFNLATLCVVGWIVERLWGRRRWLIFYLVGGFVGECAGLAWKPIGAGNSVAVFGLLGALAVWLLFRIKTWQARLGGAFLIIGACVMTGIRDLHGPPLLAGACIAGAYAWSFKADKSRKNSSK